VKEERKNRGRYISFFEKGPPAKSRPASEVQHRSAEHQNSDDGNSGSDLTPDRLSTELRVLIVGWWPSAMAALFICPLAVQQIGQLGEIRRDPSRLVLAEQLGCAA